jgi:hypothetical protein
MQSAVSGLMQAFKAEFPGTDWDNIAYGMHLYGSAGINCWGTLCGIPNGCVAFLNLIGLHGALGGEALGYYSSGFFPTSSIPDLHGDLDYGPSGTLGLPWNWTPIADIDVKAKTTSYSPLCHVSISKWCYAAQVDLNDKTPAGMVYKNDRCSKICADMAGNMAKLIADYALGNGVVDPYVVPAGTAECKTCHWKVSDPYSAEQFPAQCGLMDCTECHTPGTYHVPAKIIIEDVWTEDGSGGVQNTFTGGDPIEVKVRFAVLGAGTAYVKTAKSKAKAPKPTGKFVTCKKDETLGTGVHTWAWSGNVPNPCTSGNGKVIITLKSYDFDGPGKQFISEVKEIHGFTIS